MEEFQGLHMAVSSCVVDGIGSALRVFKKGKVLLEFRLLVQMYDSLSPLLQLGGLFEQLSHTDHTPQAAFTLSPA